MPLVGATLGATVVFLAARAGLAGLADAGRAAGAAARSRVSRRTRSTICWCCGWCRSFRSGSSTWSPALVGMRLSTYLLAHLSRDDPGHLRLCQPRQRARHADRRGPAARSARSCSGRASCCRSSGSPRWRWCRSSIKRWRDAQRARAAMSAPLDPRSVRHRRRRRRARGRGGRGADGGARSCWSSAARWAATASISAACRRNRCSPRRASPMPGGAAPSSASHYAPPRIDFAAVADSVDRVIAAHRAERFGRAVRGARGHGDRAPRRALPIRRTVRAGDTDDPAAPLCHRDRLDAGGRRRSPGSTRCPI